MTMAAAGCGNPTAIAALKPGEAVLDLGSGGGIDCFLAAQQVGPSGRVIGVDMTPEMVSLARQNALGTGATNVEFRLGEMEHLPVESGTVDVVISNCVINLSPDKATVFAEALRVLKPGGRFSVSDIVLVGTLPEGMRQNLELWGSCIPGALEKDVFLRDLATAGFVEVEVHKLSDWQSCAASDTSASCCGPDMSCCGDSAAPTTIDLKGLVASMEVTARKPA